MAMRSRNARRFGMMGWLFLGQNNHTIGDGWASVSHSLVVRQEGLLQQWQVVNKDLDMVAGFKQGPVIGELLPSARCRFAWYNSTVPPHFEQQQPEIMWDPKLLDALAVVAFVFLFMRAPGFRFFRKTLHTNVLPVWRSDRVDSQMLSVMSIYIFASLLDLFKTRKNLDIIVWPVGLFVGNRDAKVQKGLDDYLATKTGAQYVDEWLVTLPVLGSLVGLPPH